MHMCSTDASPFDRSWLLHPRDLDERPLSETRLDECSLKPHHNLRHLFRNAFSIESDDRAHHLHLPIPSAFLGRFVPPRAESPRSPTFPMAVTAPSAVISSVTQFTAYSSFPATAAITTSAHPLLTALTTAALNPLDMKQRNDRIRLTPRDCQRDCRQALLNRSRASQSRCPQPALVQCTGVLHRHRLPR
jgi:hypothetical protein